jgi:hypothetical protein
MPVSFLAAQLATAFVGCFLYGISLVTLGLTLRVLLTEESGRLRTRSQTNWITVSVSVILLLNSTLDLGTDVIDAFVVYNGPGGPAHVFMEGSGWRNKSS